MKILHVATLVTPDGAYGGPIRVAINQLRELQSRGHRVALAAGCSGFPGEPPLEISGVPVRLFPVTRIVPRTGFAGLASPRLLLWVRRQLRLIDVLHVHVARDLVTLPTAWLATRSSTALVLQTHGMIDASDRRSARALDQLLTRSVLDSAKAVLCLTPIERAAVKDISSKAHLRMLGNGVPAASPLSAGDAATPREVLFLARLQDRKRPDHFVEAARVLAARHGDVLFTLVGPDEGMGAKVETLIRLSGYADRIRWIGSLPPEHTSERMDQAYVYVLPSKDEPFPMTVLESLAVGTPVVITDTCGLAADVSRAGAGVVTNGTVADLVAAVDFYLSDPGARSGASNSARLLADSTFSMNAIATTLEDLYADA